jgi:cell shape-determining protein MreD
MITIGLCVYSFIAGFVFAADAQTSLYPWSSLAYGLLWPISWMFR